MAYATTEDVQARMTRTLTEAETSVCEALLEDAAAIIDATGTTAADGVKLVVSCRMAIRALGDGGEAGYPIGATQATMTAGPYTQSWTVGSSGSAGELYLGKTDRQLLGLSSRIGSYSPAEELVPP